MNGLKRLKEHYASLTDDELRNIATTSELEPEAREVLKQELQQRDIRDLEQYQQQMQRDDAAQADHERDRLEARDKRLRFYGRVGYVLCALLGIAGAVSYLISGAAKGGVTTMVVAAICVPAVWLQIWIRRMSVRLRLRAWSQSHGRPTIQSSGRDPANAGSRR